jgi:hypothetical protein
MLFVMCLGVAGLACASELLPDPGWFTSETMDQAIEIAKKKGMPIVILHAKREGFHGASHSYMRSKELDGFVKVLVYESGRPPKAFGEIAGQVERPDPWLPVMYFASSDLRILGFVQSDAQVAKVARNAGVAKQLFAWVSKTAADVKRAEKLVADGKLKAAKSIYERVVVEDIKNTVLVNKTWEAVLDEKDAKPIYFPDVPDKLKGLEDIAQQRLQEASAHFDKKEYAEAKKILEPMVRDNADLEAVKKAKDLLQQVLKECKGAPSTAPGDTSKPPVAPDKTKPANETDKPASGPYKPVTPADETDKKE